MSPLFTPVNFLAVGIGAALGAWLRWLLAAALNGPGAWPWGTLVANLAGGYVIGLLLGLFAGHADWPLWLRLGCITGFLGALTTFSTFSAEVVAMLERGAIGAALAYAGLSLAACLCLTALGLLTVRGFG